MMGRGREGRIIKDYFTSVTGAYKFSESIAAVVNTLNLAQFVYFKKINKDMSFSVHHKTEF